eukprot:4733649-Amphidinium_carterae.1
MLSTALVPLPAAERVWTTLACELTQHDRPLYLHMVVDLSTATRTKTPMPCGLERVLQCLHAILQMHI